MERHNPGHRRESTRDGDVRERGALAGGLRHGLWRTWDDNGRLLAEAMYWRGERVWSIEYGASESCAPIDADDERSP